MSIRRKKRKHCVRVGQPLQDRTAANQECALDFVHDAVDCGRAIRVLSVVDAYTREWLVLEVDTSFASRRVTRVLEAIERTAADNRIADARLPTRAVEPATHLRSVLFAGNASSRGASRSARRRVAR